MKSGRIHVFGASGSGTTTLGQAVAKQLQVPFFDVDSYFWKETDPPFTKKRPTDERISGLERDIDDESGWVISGSMCGWGDSLMPRFSLAVFVYLDPKIRMQRLWQRERERYGARIDPGGDMYRIHRDFIEWASAYDSAGMDMRSLKIHEWWVGRLNCPVARLNGSDPIEILSTKVIENAG